MSETLFLIGRPWRHGFRVEGSYIKKKYGVPHMFFKSELKALEFLISEEKEAQS